MLCASAGLGVALLFITPAAAQYPTIINVPPAVAPAGIGPSTQLNLYQGGAILGSFNSSTFGLDGNAELNVFGGSTEAELIVGDQGTINVYGGTVGAVSSINAGAGSVVNVGGGQIARRMSVAAGGWLNQTGGTIGHDASIAEGRLSGGSLGTGVSLGSGVELVGEDFRLNGVAYAGATITLDTGDRFTGVLADGSPFVFSQPTSDGLNAVRLTRDTPPPIDTTPIVVSGASPSGPYGLRHRQSLTLLEGGTLPNNFTVRGGILTVEAGTVGLDLEVVNGTANIGGGLVAGRVNLFDESILNVSGGSIGSIAFPIQAFAGAEVNLSGGRIAGRLITHAGSRVNVTGGSADTIAVVEGADVQVSGGKVGIAASDGSLVRVTGGSIGGDALEGSEILIEGGAINDRFDAGQRSRVTLKSGRIGDNFFANSRAVVTVEGGTIGEGFELHGLNTVTISGGTFGGGFDSFSGDLRVLGGEYRLNGAAFPGDRISVTGDDVFTGTLADGSPFVFSGETDDFYGIRLERRQLSASSPTTRLIDATTATVPAGLRSGQSAAVRPGGVLGDNFAVVDAELVVEGGVVGRSAEVARGQVTVQAGQVGERFRVYQSAVAHLMNGSIGPQMTVLKGGTANLTGGAVGSYFEARAGSTVSLSGGAVGKGFRARDGADTTILGGEFNLNGSPYAGEQISLQAGDVFTGALAEGSPFVFSSETEDELVGVKLMPVALPTIATAPIVVDAATTTPPNGLRPGQSLTVWNGGSLAEHFAAVGASIRVEGGEIGTNAEVVGTTVTLDGGVVASGFKAYQESHVNVRGGEIQQGFTAVGGTLVEVSGGRLDYTELVESELVLSGGSVESLIATDSTLSIAGGHVGEGLGISGDSRVSLSGGLLEGGIDAYSGVDFHWSGGTLGNDTRFQRGSRLHLYGTEFFRNGSRLPLAEGESITIDDWRPLGLSGRLADGGEFGFDEVVDEPVTITRVATRLQGDYNADGVVDAADYTVWREASDSPGSLLADGNYDGVVDRGDFAVWAANLGTSAQVTSTPAVVPEPLSVWFLTVSLIPLVTPRR